MARFHNVQGRRRRTTTELPPVKGWLSELTWTPSRQVPFFPIVKTATQLELSVVATMVFASLSEDEQEYLLAMRGDGLSGSLPDYVQGLHLVRRYQILPKTYLSLKKKEKVECLINIPFEIPWHYQIDERRIVASALEPQGGSQQRVSG